MASLCYSYFTLSLPHEAVLFHGGSVLSSYFTVPKAQTQLSEIILMLCFSLSKSLHTGALLLVSCCIFIS